MPAMLLFMLPMIPVLDMELEALDGTIVENALLRGREGREKRDRRRAGVEGGGEKTSEKVGKNMK